jgi:hypothetical protein
LKYLNVVMNMGLYMQASCLRENADGMAIVLT